MRRILYILAGMLAIMVLAGSGLSCKNRDLFNEESYDSMVKQRSPVDSVDPNHTWELSATQNLHITANAGVGTQMIQILTADPDFSESANVIAQVPISEGETTELSFSYPRIISKLFAAAIDSEGRYTLVDFTPSDSIVDFSAPLYRQRSVTYIPSLQYYAFCFENEFPDPGDYDYNDVVLHIAFERATKQLMKIHVRLAAVGATEQIASLIRLPDFKYDDIDSIFTEGNKSFNEGISKQYMTVFDQTDLLVEGREDEALINLFGDAHWATGDVLNEDYGTFKRKYYNVARASNSDNQLMVPREIVYVIRVNDEKRLNSMNLDNIDPFLIHQYNGGRMEIHTYKYRHVQTLYEYYYSDSEHLPWALKIPKSWFNHPLEGVSMGSRTRESSTTEMLFGAYAVQGHAFGEWAMDKDRFLDWFDYPKSNYFIW